MKTILPGRCLCGSVRYECTADPGNARYCHCDDFLKAGSLDEPELVKPSFQSWTKRAVPPGLHR